MTGALRRLTRVPRGRKEPQMENTEQAKAFFQNDIFATEILGAEIVEAAPRHAVCRLPYDRRVSNAMGHVMGGALFSLCDLAFATAANSSDISAVTLSSDIHFLRPASAASGTLTAEAVCIHDGGHTCVYRVGVTDESGTLICEMTVNGYKIRRSF